MHRMFKIFSLCLLTLAGLSCLSNQNTQDSHLLKPFLDQPRVFYGTTGDPVARKPRSDYCDELSLEELNQIQTLISERTQQSIWFVRVPLSSSRDHRGQLWVYLAPDIANARYRSGLAYTIGLFKSRSGQWRVSTSPQWRYVQVSLPDKEFGPVLETPEVFDLPFRYPSQNQRGSESEQDLLSEKELVDLLNYVRNPDMYLEFEGPNTNSEESLADRVEKHRNLWLLRQCKEMVEIVVSQPVVSIRKGAGDVTVTFGFIHNGLYARCYSVKLRITEQGYELIDLSFWIS